MKISDRFYCTDYITPIPSAAMDLSDGIMPDITSQYDSMGQKYLAVGKDHWFSSKPDLWARSKISQFIPSFEGKVVIDGGCGSGIDMYSYLSRGATRVLGFDPSILMLNTAMENVHDFGPLADSVEFKQGTFESIPYTDQSADIIIGVYSLHYCLDLDIAYAEIYRVLKTGGRLVFICTHPSEMTNTKHSPYKGQEIVPFKIYNKSVEILKPTHTLSEYLSSFFLQLFTLEHLEEWYPEEASGKELKFPKLIAFCATKKQ